jgi:hypothetical protein
MTDLTKEELQEKIETVKRDIARHSGSGDPRMLQGLSEYVSYLEDELNSEEFDEIDIEKYSLDIVKQNILHFKNTIDEFQSNSYEFGSWEIDIDELNLPKLEVN